MYNSTDKHFQRKNKWFQTIRHSVFCNLTLKDNSGGLYVKKIMTTVFTFLKRRNYKHNCQVGYSSMNSVLFVMKYACCFESYWESKKMHTRNVCMVIQ